MLKSGHDEYILSERERSILRAIVRLYILKAAPIGSRHLSKMLEDELKLSAATIRNVMSDLEEMQFISHPHTSAGRVPTDKGYRFYVDSLMQPAKLSPEEARTVRDSLSGDNPESLLKEAARILGMLSKYLGVVELPGAGASVVEKLELVRLSSTRLLTVLALDSKLVRTVTFEVRFEIDEHSIDRISALINERISGRTLSFIRENFAEMMSDTAGEPEPLIRLFFDSVDKLFDERTEGDRIKIAGTPNLLEHPEFEERRLVKGVIELIENDEAIVHILDQMEETDGVRALIGSEIQNEFLDDYSLIVTNYKIGSAYGSIGLIGPKRMNYAKMFSIVSYVSSMLSGKIK